MCVLLPEEKYEKKIEFANIFIFPYEKSKKSKFANILNLYWLRKSTKEEINRDLQLDIPKF